MQQIGAPKIQNEPTDIFFTFEINWLLEESITMKKF